MSRRTLETPIRTTDIAVAIPRETHADIGRYIIPRGMKLRHFIRLMWAVFKLAPAELIDQTSAVYIKAYESITGERFVPDDSGETPLARVRSNLARYFP